jgi:hypothetical protein
MIGMKMSSMLSGPDAIPDDERAFPEGVDYMQSLPLGKKASSSVRKFQPTNGQVFNPAGQNIIRIPINTSGFVDVQHSYLRFELQCDCRADAKGNDGVTYKAAAAQALDLAVWALDGSAHSIIQQLRIEGSDGQELENIRNYNILHAFLADMHMTADHGDSYANIQEGNDVAGLEDPVSITGSRGPLFAGPTNNQSSAAGARVEGTKYIFTIPLMSGLLAMKHYLPAGFIRGGGVVLEMTLAPALDAFRAIVIDTPLVAGSNWHTAAGGSSIAFSAAYRVSNVQYISRVVDFTADFNSKFVAALQEEGGIQMPMVTYYSHEASLGANDGSAVFTIAERARSIKALFTLFMLPDDAYEVNRVLQKRITARPWPGLRQYQYKIGALSYPLQPVEAKSGTASSLVPYPFAQVAPGIRTGPSGVEYFSELLKAFNRISDIQSGGQIQSLNYMDPAFGSAQGTAVSYASGSAVNMDVAVIVADAIVAGTKPVATITYTDRGAKFAIGCDFEAFPQDQTLLQSGFDTASSALPVQLEITRDTWGQVNAALGAEFIQVGAPGSNFNSIVANTNRRVLTFAMVDALLSLDRDGFMITAK